MDGWKTAGKHEHVANTELGTLREKLVCAFIYKNRLKHNIYFAACNVVFFTIIIST